MKRVKIKRENWKRFEFFRTIDFALNFQFVIDRKNLVKMKWGKIWGKADKSWIFHVMNILPVDVDCSEKLLEDFVIVQSSHESLQGLTSLILTLSFFRIFSHLHSFLGNHFFLKRKIQNLFCELKIKIIFAVYSWLLSMHFLHLCWP